MKKIEGVESVKVSLNQGRAWIRLKLGNSIRLEQIRKAVNQQGFTPKEARIKAVGDLTATDGRLQFQVSGSNEVFPVVETSHESWRKHAAQELLVTGIIAAPATDKEPGTIQIVEVSKPNATPK